MLERKTIEQNGFTSLVFELSSDIVVSKSMLLKVNNTACLIPVDLVEKTGGCILTYNAGSSMSLSKYLRQNYLKSDTVLAIFEEICKIIISVKDVGLHQENLSFDTDCLFWDSIEKKVKMTYLTYETRQQLLPESKAMFLKIVQELLIISEENESCIAAIKEYFNEQIYNLDSFITFLEEQKLTYSDLKQNKKKAKNKGKWRSFLENLFLRQKSVIKGDEKKMELTPEPIKIIPQKIDGETEFLIMDDNNDDELDLQQKNVVQLGITFNEITKQVEIRDFPCVIGRSSQVADLIMEDSTVSRKHATFDQLDGEFFITDNNSGNGVSLNGLKISPEAEQIICEGDLIKIGRTEIKIERIEKVE